MHVHMRPALCEFRLTWQCAVQRDMAAARSDAAAAKSMAAAARGEAAKLRADIAGLATTVAALQVRDPPALADAAHSTVPLGFGAAAHLHR